MQDAVTSPVNFLPEPPSSTATNDPSTSKTSAMEFIDQAALPLHAQATLAHLPRLPRTVHELLLDPVDITTDRARGKHTEFLEREVYLNMHLLVIYA